MDQNTLTKSVEKLKNLYRLEKITVVADRGLNSGSNLEHLCNGGHDFVISYTLKRSPGSFKELVWSNEGRTDYTDRETGEVTSRSKIMGQVMVVKVPIEEEEVERKSGRPGSTRKLTYRSRYI